MRPRSGSRRREGQRCCAAWTNCIPYRKTKGLGREGNLYLLRSCCFLLQTFVGCCFYAAHLLPLNEKRRPSGKPGIIARRYAAIGSGGATGFGGGSIQCFGLFGSKSDAL